MNTKFTKILHWFGRLAVVVVGLTILFIAGVVICYVRDDDAMQSIGSVSNGEYTVTTQRYSTGWSVSPYIKVVLEDKAGNKQLLLAGDYLDTASVKFIDSQTVRVYLLANETHVPYDSFTFQLEKEIVPITLKSPYE